jgi:hypothetical protein
MNGGLAAHRGAEFIAVLRKPCKLRLQRGHTGSGPPGDGINHCHLTEGAAADDDFALFALVQEKLAGYVLD